MKERGWDPFKAKEQKSKKPSGEFGRKEKPSSKIAWRRARSAGRKKLNKTISEKNNNALKVNEEVIPTSKRIANELKHRSKQTHHFFTKNKWGRRLGYFGLTIISLNLARSMLNNIFRSEGRAIPSEYERGYDIIKENLTDFGSPLRLIKTLKVGMPYYSTVRKATNTTIASVRANNPALAMHRNAIQHTRY